MRADTGPGSAAGQARTATVVISEGARGSGALYCAHAFTLLLRMRDVARGWDRGLADSHLFGRAFSETRARERARRAAFSPDASSLVCYVASYLTSVPAPRTRLAIYSNAWLRRRRLCSMLVLVARLPAASNESLRVARGLRFRPLPPPSPSRLLDDNHPAVNLTSPNLDHLTAHAALAHLGAN